MSLRTILIDLANAISDEAERNSEFSERLQTVLQSIEKSTQPAAAPTTQSTARRPVRRRARRTTNQRPANRRPAAVLDPIELAVKGEDVLRKALEPLALDQLKDIVADYGMDQDKLAMKWKTPDRVIDRIVDTSLRRAYKGDAFRS